MSYLNLSWVIGAGEDRRGGNKDNVTIDEIIVYVEEVLKHSGTLTLNIIDGPEIGPQSLQVQTDKGYSVIMLGEDDGNDYNVRTFTNDYATEREIVIHGHIWDARSVTQNPNIVKAVFKEFVTTGNVSLSLLS